MSAAVFTTIREALEELPDGTVLRGRDGNADAFIRNRQRDEAIAALDRIEQNTLTPEEAQQILSGKVLGEARAKLGRIAGNTPTSIRAKLDGETP